MSAHLLLVEDDAHLARGLQFNVEREGFSVTAVATGREEIERALAGGIDLILLDLSLPDLDGIEVLRTLRARGFSTPVICLTARGAETDKVMGLGIGADDYVTKPFGLAELLARIHALLRRAGPRAAAITFEGVSIDLAARIVVRDGRRDELTTIETDLLRYLSARRGVAVDRAQILKDLWGITHAMETRTLDNHVLRLRKKIEPDPEKPRFLVTVHGHGYRLAVEPRTGL